MNKNFKVWKLSTDAQKIARKACLPELLKPIFSDVFIAHFHTFPRIIPEIFLGFFVGDFSDLCAASQKICFTTKFNQQMMICFVALANNLNEILHHFVSGNFNGIFLSDWYWAPRIDLCQKEINLLLCIIMHTQWEQRH